MKKILCMILMVTMLLASCAFAETTSEDIKDFEPRLTNAIGRDTDGWYETSQARAMLTVLMMSDLVLEGLSDEFDFASSLITATYVGRSGSQLLIIFPGEDSLLAALYDPDMGHCAYGFTSATDSQIVEMVLESSCTDGYFENNLSDILAAAQELSEILST